MIALQESLQNPPKIVQLLPLVVDPSKIWPNPVFKRILKKASKTAQQIHTGRVDAKANSTRVVWNLHGACGFLGQIYTGRVQLLDPRRDFSRFLRFSTDCSAILSRASSSSHMRIPIFICTWNPPINAQIKVSQQQTRKTEKMVKMHVFIGKCNVIKGNKRAKKVQKMHLTNWKSY